MPASDFLAFFKEITNSLPVYSDLYLMAFVQYRNLVTGSNTITKAGLTSPNSKTTTDGAIRLEFPALSPNGQNISMSQGNGDSIGLPADLIAWLRSRGYNI
jgi:hypothetical protein